VSSVLSRERVLRSHLYQVIARLSASHGDPLGRRELRGRRGCGGGVRKTHSHHYLSFVISTYVSVIIILSEREREKKKILSSRVCGICATIATRQINERVRVCVSSKFVRARATITTTTTTR